MKYPVKILRFMAVFAIIPFISGSFCNAFWLTAAAAENTAPTAKNVSGETYIGIQIELPLEASDPDGDEILLKLEDTPKLGTASIVGDTLQYTPKDKTGTDKFSFVAVDSMGNQSKPAEISIKITKNSAKFTYADMNDDPAHFAALQLADEGIMSGEKIGSSYFFRPDETVTRNEFIAMTAAIADFDIKETSQTDFIDDGGLSDWVKPYISAAAANGIISGYQTASGACEIRGENDITLAEACVMLGNLIEYDDYTVQTMSSDTTYAPVWAQTACAALTASDIIPDDITAETSRLPITRADACEMLYRTMQKL